MPGRKKLKVIIDTNLFISFLIGKRLKSLKKSLIDSNITLIFSEQSIQELIMVTTRDKFRKYFPLNDVHELEGFIRLIGKVFEIADYEHVCRDPKDDFLLGLAKKSRADYLVTGDKDLLDLKKYRSTEIITIDMFERSMVETTSS